MKLFLTSAGIVPEITDEFLRLLNKKPHDCRTVFVSTAGDPENDKSFIEADKSRLRELGFEIIEVDLKKQNQKSLEKIFEITDIVFVAGGNTFYLLDWARKSGFGKAIKKFLEKGGVYVGVSAGSIIAGLNIEFAGWGQPDPNVVGIKDLTGMKLVPFFIKPHYCREIANDISVAAEKIDYPVVALTDTQAVLIDNGYVKIVGLGKKTIFNNSLGL